MSESPTVEVGAPGGTILVVDDDASLQTLISTILKGAGYQALVAASSAEALAAAQRYPGRLALLITDVMMPGISGPELARRLRAGRDSPKVLLLSGYERRDLPDDLDGLDFIEKPFTAKELVRKVCEMLGS